MNKTELISAVAKKVDCTKVATEPYINAVLETIVETVASGDSIKIIGFGAFEAKNRSERIARNPKTGETVTVPKKCVPVFKAGKEFKDAVAER